MNAFLAKAKRCLSGFAATLRPIGYRPYEIVIMRVLLALVVLRVWPGGTDYTEQLVPVGLGRVIDFSFLADAAVFRALEIGLHIALVVFCTGRLLWLALPYITFCVLAIGTLENSQGADQHSTQIVALVMTVLCAWHVFAAIKRRARREADLAGVWFAQQAIAAAYIVSALSKWLAKGDWVRDSYQFPLQVIKSQDMDYYNRLEPAAASSGKYPVLSDAMRPLASWMEKLMIEHPQWAPLLVSPGFFLELCAFLLLGGRKLGAAVALGLIFFHLTVAEMMGLNFKFNIYLLAIFFLGIPHWLERAGRGALLKIKPHSDPHPAQS